MNGTHQALEVMIARVHGWRDWTESSAAVHSYDTGSIRRVRSQSEGRAHDGRRGTRELGVAADRRRQQAV
jgi:hypothetical protein